MVAAHGVRKPSADADHQQRRQRQADPEAGPAAAAAALQQAASGQQLHAAGEPCAPTATLTAGSRTEPAASAAASSLAGRQPLASTGLLRGWVGTCVTLTDLWQVALAENRLQLSLSAAAWQDTTELVDTRLQVPRQCLLIGPAPGEAVTSMSE